MLDFDANHVGHGRRVDKIDVGGAKRAVVVVLPVFHEDANDFMALLFEQIGAHRRVHTAAQAHHNPLLLHGAILPAGYLAWLARG